MTNSYIFNDSSLFKKLASKREVHFPKLVIVPKSQPGVQMNLSCSDLPEEVQKLVKENSVEKIIYHVKTKNVPANYVVELYDNENVTTNVYTDYTRYEFFFTVQKTI